MLLQFHQMKNNAMKCLKFLLHWRTVCFFLFSLAAIIFISYNQSYSFVSSATGKHKLKTTKKYVSTLCNCQREVVVVDDEEPNNFISNVLHDDPSRSESSSDFQWCGPESSMRGKGQKVISFVLYGHQQVNERYSSLIRNISSTAENMYPGWVVRIIYKIFDTTRRAAVDEDLCDAYCQFNNIDLCSMSDLIDRLRRSNRTTTSSNNNLIDPDLLVGLHPKMWRFLAILDPNVDVFISRDLDSLIWQREVDAVGQWIRSNFTFHSMRDHPQHDVTFLGGMWGAKLDRRRDLIEGLTRAIVRYGQGQTIEGPADQTVLNEIIWPVAQYDVMVHDSYHCLNSGLHAKTYPLKVFPFPTKRDGRLFVGGIGGNPTVDTKCPEACRPQDGKDWEYC